MHAVWQCQEDACTAYRTCGGSTGITIVGACRTRPDMQPASQFQSNIQQMRKKELGGKQQHLRGGGLDNTEHSAGMPDHCARRTFSKTSHLNKKLSGERAARGDPDTHELHNHRLLERKICDDVVNSTPHKLDIRTVNGACDMHKQFAVVLACQDAVAPLMNSSAAW